MRPSAAQHEGIETIHKVAEMYVSQKVGTTKSSISRFEIVKGRRSVIGNRECEVAIREQTVQEKEQWLAAIIQKDQEIATLQRMIEQLQKIPQISQQDIKQTVAR